MANFDVAFNWMIINEDASRQWKEATDNNGGGVIAGVNSKSFPQDFAHIASLPQDQREVAIKDFYHRNFWGWESALNSDEVARRVFDAGVNMGRGPAARLLQVAIPEAGGSAVAIDGALGPNTVAAANACDQAQLVLTFKAARVQYYRDIVENNPDALPYLAGWLARAQK